MNSAYLLMGSNEGDRAHLLSEARKQIEEAGIIQACSRIYETEAWGKEGMPEHLNQAIQLITRLDPEALLKKLQQIEINLGRKRTDKWGLRTMDIDIIYFENQIIRYPQLQVPHPLMQLRRFVLVPLVEIAPSFRHPELLKTNKELLDALEDPLAVKLYLEAID